MTELLPAATGSTPVAGLKPDLNSHDAERKTHQAWESTQTGPGRGRRIDACSTTAPLAIRRVSLGIPSAGRSGGTKHSRSGLVTTYPISKWTRIPRITWVRSA